MTHYRRDATIHRLYETIPINLLYTLYFARTFVPMAKQQERQIAKTLYFQNKDHKEIAASVNVSEKTIGKWVRQYNWKTERQARFNGHKEQIENLKRLIGELTEERIEISKQLRTKEFKKDDEEKSSLERKGSRLADEISKYSKALEQLDQENRIPLTVHLEVMDALFHSMNMYSPKLYADSISFQEDYISKLSQKFS